MVPSHTAQQLHFSRQGHIIAALVGPVVIAFLCAVIGMVMADDPPVVRDFTATGGRLIFEPQRDHSRDKLVLIACCVGILGLSFFTARAFLRLIANEPALAIKGREMTFHYSFFGVPDAIALIAILSAKVMTAADARSESDQFFDTMTPLTLRPFQKRMQQKLVLKIIYVQKDGDHATFQLPAQFAAGGHESLDQFSKELNRAKDAAQAWQDRYHVPLAM